MSVSLHRVALPVLLACAVSCGRSSPTSDSTSAAGSAAPRAAAAPQTTAAPGPIDVCRIVTAADAAALMGPLPQQPPANTDNVGFGISACMYIGPRLSGDGAQTKLARLTIQAGRGKGPADMLQDDVDKRRATASLPGVGDAAKRNEAGSFVWTTKDGVSCTAEISNGLPPALTADAAAQGLGRLCEKVLIAATR